MTGGGRMDNTGKKLAKLFDFQKYENEFHLAKVISDTEKAFSGIRAISDDDLDMVAGGAANNNTGNGDDPQAYGRCKECGGYLSRNGTGYICKSCGNMYDKNKNHIGKAEPGPVSFFSK